MSQEVTLYDGEKAVNTFTSTTHGENFRQIAEEFAKEQGYTFSPVTASSPTIMAEEDVVISGLLAAPVETVTPEEDVTKNSSEPIAYGISGGLVGSPTNSASTLNVIGSSLN